MTTKQITSKEKIKSSEDYTLKHRIRYDRANRLVIDRYIQKPFSLSPFDDDFNSVVNNYKIFNEDFGKLFSLYNLISLYQ